MSNYDLLGELSLLSHFSVVVHLYLLVWEGKILSMGKIHINICFFFSYLNHSWLMVDSAYIF